MTAMHPTVPHVAIYFPHLTREDKASISGAAFRIMHAIELLRNRCRVTLVTCREPEWDTLNKYYGTSIRAGDVAVLLTQRWLGIGDDAVFVAPYCGRSFDLCISGHNVVDFRRPALHFVANCRFDDLLANAAGAPLADDVGLPRSRSVTQWMARTIKKSAKWIATTAYAGPPRGLGAIIRSQSDTIVANSQWIAQLISSCYGVAPPPVLYPPVVAEFPRVPWQQRRPDFVCVGRIDFEKNLEQVIEIVERVRARGLPEAKLTIAGKIRDTWYGKKILGQIRSRPWIQSVGDVYGAEKATLIASHRFALHACAIEGFGISVAEYVKAGVVPFVPHTGGAAEIVPHPELQFRTTAEAVHAILRMLRQPERQRALHEELLVRAKRFDMSVFRQGFVQIVESALADRARGLNCQPKQRCEPIA